MDFIHIEGSETEVIHTLSEFMNEGSVLLLIRSMPLYSTLLDDCETFKRADNQPSENDMGLIVPKSNYFVNMKKTTIALVGLLLDVRFTMGFSSFVLSHFGIQAEAIRKLSPVEKCVLLHIKASSIRTSEGTCYINSPTLCIQKGFDCEHRSTSINCEITNESLEHVLKALIEKDVISISNGKHSINF